MIEGRFWALLSLLRAAVLSSSRLAGQKLANACRLSQAHRNSTGFKSGEYGGKNAICTSPLVESRYSRTSLLRCAFRPSQMISSGRYR